MAAQHVSIPKPFKEGDAREWFQRFEICCRANEWNDAKKARKLPTLLEGEPLSIWLEATEEEQAEFRTMKRKDHYQNGANCLFVVTGISQPQNAVWRSSFSLPV